MATASSLEWGVLDRLAGQMQKHDAEVHRAREQELRKRLRQDLDRQVEDAHLKQEREREEALRYHEMQQSALQQWKQEEEANAKAMKALRVHNSQAHTEQMDRMRSQRERRLQEEMRDAQAAVDAHHRDTELQRLQAADRWNHRREIAQEALAVSNASVKIRDEMRRRQEDIEQQSVEAHQRQLQKREQDMKQQHVRQQEVLEAKYAAASEVLAATKLKPPGDDDLREEATRSALYAKRELEDRRRAASIRADTQAYQVEQMRQKATAKQKEADLKQQIRTSQEREVKDHLEGLRMKSRERRVLNLAHRVELERQMLSKTHGAPKGDTMTEAELRINRDLLEKVNRALGGVPPSSAGTAR